MGLIFKIIFKLERIINAERSRQLISRIGHCGKDVRIDHNCHILVPQKFSIGDHSSISSYTTIYATFGVTIGSNCLISSNCGISSYNHIQSSENRPGNINEDVNFSKPVVIGDNVWIGMNACILPGVTIGNNSIIGSGSIVTKDVPANEIWVGNPAKFVKKLIINTGGA
jgi:maltose O-acetyltransferase